MKIMSFISLLFLFEFKLLIIIMIHFSLKRRISVARVSGIKWAISKVLVTADICEVLIAGTRQYMHLLTVSSNDANVIPILLR